MKIKIPNQLYHIKNSWSTKELFSPAKYEPGFFLVAYINKYHSVDGRLLFFKNLDGTMGEYKELYMPMSLGKWCHKNNIPIELYRVPGTTYLLDDSYDCVIDVTAQQELEFSLKF